MSLDRASPSHMIIECGPQAAYADSPCECSSNEERSCESRRDEFACRANTSASPSASHQSAEEKRSVRRAIPTRNRHRLVRQARTGKIVIPGTTERSSQIILMRDELTDCARTAWEILAVTFRRETDSLIAEVL